MRNLPHKLSFKQKLIIEAVRDYFGEIKGEEKKSVTKIALWLMGRKKGNVLMEEEQEILEMIKLNLADKVYRRELAESLI